MLQGYEGLVPYWGDIHNHCDISYGHGSPEDAFSNARLQLDFVSVTAHAHWPDLPESDSRLASVNAYHRDGFHRALEQWPRYRELTNSVNVDGSFVAFLSFEWHSLRSGDHNVYYKDGSGEIIPAYDLNTMRAQLRKLEHHGIESLLIPHHIGYMSGYRGINWSEFTPEFSPFVEIFSMHGASESDDAPYPYLHTMGPRHSRSTMQHGLAEGHIFGVVGSTDSHSAHPGSFGHGRLSVWAKDLSRESIWNALKARRTVALTGDNIKLAFAINGMPIGSVLSHVEQREISVEVVGGDAIDYVEIVHNNRVLHRWSVLDSAPTGEMGDYKVALEMGWGEMDEEVDWHADLQVTRGRLLAVEPRFRGRDIVSPQQSLPHQFRFSDIELTDENGVRFSTRSWRNPTIVSPATQGVSLHLSGDGNTALRGEINGHSFNITIKDLLNGSHVGYLGGFLTPAYVFHRANPDSSFVLRETITHEGTETADNYYVRVRQRNNQWAWSSPIWVRTAN